MRDARNGHSKWSEGFRKIIGGRFAFHVRAEGENDFRDRLILNPREQRTDAELLGSNVVQGREPSPKDMVAAFEEARSFDRKNVSGLLDDADLPAGAVFILTDLATLLRGKEAADGAGAKVFSRASKRSSQFERSRIFRGSQPESDTFRGARPNPGKAPQLTGEVAERFRIINGLHLPARRRMQGCLASPYDDVKSAIWSLVTTSSSPRLLRSTRWM
jgi:hypothetical protein